MSDSDDFFNTEPAAAESGIRNRHYEFGSGSRHHPQQSDGVPRQSSQKEDRTRSSIGFSEEQIEVQESKGSKLYSKSHEYESQDFEDTDTKKVQWSDSDNDSNSFEESPRYKQLSPKMSVPKKLKKFSGSDDSFSEASKSSQSQSRSSSSTSSWDSGSDVSPLQSPDRSQNRSKSAKGKQYSDLLLPRSRGRERPNKADIRDVHDKDNLDLNHILEAILDLEAQQQKMPEVPTKYKQKRQPNYSFTDSRIQSIERDNQRLLQKILELQQSKVSKKQARLPTGSITRLHHTTINRQREQRKIEQENLRIMKRLQTVKPTPGHSREEQLSSYWRQATYGVPKFAFKAANAPDPDDLYTTYHGNSGIRRRPTSAYSTQSKTRSRPTSGVPSGRARPWSATSNTSLRSAASGRSGASFRTASTESSKVRLRPRSAKATLADRPVWEDRW